jgi:hypothetical protein
LGQAEPRSGERKRVELIDPGGDDMTRKKEDSHIIVAIHVTNRVKQASLVQAVLTQYGKNIKTRIGLHEATGRTAAPNGVILLELVGASRCTKNIMAALNGISGVEAQHVVFEH